MNKSDKKDIKLARKILRSHENALGTAEQERMFLLAQLEKHTRRGNARIAAHYAEQLARVLHELEALKDLVPNQGFQNPGEAQFLFSSVYLIDSFELCTVRRAEGMHLIVGIEHEGIRIATKILEIPYSYRSEFGASADKKATIRANIESHEAGHKILGWIHSHPGNGILSNHPSPTDMDMQDHWEFHAQRIGGIWSRDKYIRFFSKRTPFEVQIKGNYVEQIDGSVFRITN